MVGAVMVSGKPGGDGATVAAEDRGAQEIGVDEVHAVRQPFLEEVDFALVGAGERVGVAVGGNGAGPGADAILRTPAAGFAGLGLGQLAAEVGDDGEDMVGGEGGAAQVGPAVNPALPEVGIGEEALPPADALQGRIAEIVGALVAAGLHIPEAGIEATDVTAVGHALAAVEVPERPHADLLAAVLVEVAAEPEGIDVPGEGVKDVMVKPGIDIDVGGVAGQRVGVVGPPERGAELGKIAGDVTGLRRRDGSTISRPGGSTYTMLPWR